MKESKEIIDRLDRLESKQAISDLVSSYGAACDQHDMKKLIGLFTENAEYDSPNGSMKCVGKKNIEEMFIEIFKTRGPSFHWTHDLIISINKEDLSIADGIVYGHAETTREGEISLAAIRYDDEYSRQEGEWYFSKRSITFHYYFKTEEYTNTFNKLNRVSMGGEKIAADFPESLEVWKAFHQKNKN